MNTIARQWYVRVPLLLSVLFGASLFVDHLLGEGAFAQEQDPCSNPTAYAWLDGNPIPMKPDMRPELVADGLGVALGDYLILAPPEVELRNPAAKDGAREALRILDESSDDKAAWQAFAEGLLAAGEIVAYQNVHENGFDAQIQEGTDWYPYGKYRIGAQSNRELFHDHATTSRLDTPRAIAERMVEDVNRRIDQGQILIFAENGVLVSEGPDFNERMGQVICDLRLAKSLSSEDSVFARQFMGSRVLETLRNPADLEARRFERDQK